MNSMSPVSSEKVADYKEKAFNFRSIDQANYIGPIDMNAIEKQFEEAFEKFAHDSDDLVDFDRFIARGEDLITIVMTAHPTFLKSMEEAGLLSKVFTAIASGDKDKITELKTHIRQTQADHPYKDPTTNEEGERLNAALKNTVNPGRIMQRAQIKVAKKLYPNDWKKGHYSPFNRATWQKHDRDGREIPVTVQLGETIRQRRLGFEWINVPAIEALKNHPEFKDPDGAIGNILGHMNTTASYYALKEKALEALDEQDPDMDALQGIIDDFGMSKEGRITHPNQIIEALQPLLDDPNTPDDLFIEAKIIVDDLVSNGLCFATPTHRTNAEDAQNYLAVERHKAGQGDIFGGDGLEADESHFQETEEMIAAATDQVSGSFTDMLKGMPQDGKSVHEMMLIRRFVLNSIDSHTIEKVDIAETHNAMTQRAVRLATIQYGVSKNTDVGILHEDDKGIDPAYEIYSKLFSSKQYLAEISQHDGNTTKKRPRIVMKIGFSDFAKQHSSPGGKPSNEKCLLQTMKAIREADLAGKVDLDIEFAGGEGPGRRVNPKGYEWTLKETVTPAILSYAKKHGIRVKYRETIQGGDGCILLGTEQSAAKVMSTQLEHLSTHLTADSKKAYDRTYYNELSGPISEHHRAARNAYHELYSNPDFAMMVKMFGAFCEKGGSRKVSRAETRSPYDKPEDNQPPLADVRAIGYNARLIQMLAHLTPILGQGTAFYQNQERTDQIIESDLFRERLMTSMMVRDLHMLDELKQFIETFNPEYWGEFPKFDDKGNLTTEAMIAQRLDDIVYSDGDNRRVYPRLKKAFRAIELDLEKFDQIIKKPVFDDVRETIREHDGKFAFDYDQAVADKRALTHDVQQDRIAIMRQIFSDLEGSPVHMKDHSRQERSGAIKAGMCMDFKGADILLGKAANANQPGLVETLKAMSAALPDLHYNT